MDNFVNLTVLCKQQPGGEIVQLANMLNMISVPMSSGKVEMTMLFFILNRYFCVEILSLHHSDSLMHDNSHLTGEQCGMLAFMLILVELVADEMT